MLERAREFLSTPSARRATLAIGDGYVYLMISIHALREEGDYFSLCALQYSFQFLSTPSVRRATR